MTQAPSKPERTILSLLAAAQEDTPSVAEPVLAVDYDWSAPSSASSHQLAELERFIERLAARGAQALGDQLHEEILLHGGRLSQHYAKRIPAVGDPGDNYFVSITGEGDEQCGLLMIRGELARGWIARALGSVDTAAGEKRDISSLECALLQDTAAKIVQVLSSEYRSGVNSPIKCGLEIATTAELPEAKDEDEYCLLPFSIGQEYAQEDITFIVASKVLVRAIGTDQADQSFGNPEDLRRDVIACIEQAFITATVRLAPIELTLQDTMNLEEGDVLVIADESDQKVEMLVGGEHFKFGYPVSCGGQYAIQISE